MTRYTLSLWLCNLYVAYIIQYAGLDKSQAGLKITGRSINIHRYEDNTTLIIESKEPKNLSSAFCVSQKQGAGTLGKDLPGLALVCCDH